VGRGLVRRLASRLVVGGDNGISQVPGRTLAPVPRSPTPEGPSRQAVATCQYRRHSTPERRLLRRRLFSGFNPAARSLAVYASQPGSLQRHARLASRLVATLCRVGLSPTGFIHERFHDGYVIDPPLPGLPWRKGRSAPRKFSPENPLPCISSPLRSSLFFPLATARARPRMRRLRTQPKPEAGRIRSRAGTRRVRMAFSVAASGLPGKEPQCGKGKEDP
jgi:hypothetical protein